MQASPLLTRLEELERRLKAEGRIRTLADWNLGAGLSKNYISALKTRLKSGEVKQAKGDELRKLAAFAGVTVEYLLGDDDVGATDQSETSTLDALKRVLIKPEYSPEVANEIARRLREDHFKITESLPFEQYLLPRGRQIVDEVLGKSRTKPAPQHEAPKPADLTQESEEVRRSRKRPRRL